MTTWPEPAGISRIAIFQALQLGDLLCATPAWRAIRQHYPQAEITLIGSKWASEMAQRLPSIDHFIPFPGYPGIAESPVFPPVPPPCWPPFDLVIQMHGAGNVSNGFVASLGARHSLGHAGPGDDRLTHARPWQEQEREPLRWLHLLEVIQVPAAGRLPTMSYMSESLHVSRRRTVPRSQVAATCWEVIAGQERSGVVVDLSWEGVRLERPFVGGITAEHAQLEIDVPGLDEVIWAKAGACFDEVVAAPVGSLTGGPLGLVRRTGYRLLTAAARDLRLPQGGFQRLAHLLGALEAALGVGFDGLLDGLVQHRGNSSLWCPRAGRLG